MSLWQGIALAVACIGVFWALGAYNRLLALRNAIILAWSALDEHLKTRHRLLIEIVGSLRAAGPEHFAVLDAALAASLQSAACAEAVRQRPTAAGRVASLSLAEGVVAAALGRLDALIAAMPDATAQIGAFTEALREVTGKIDFARQWFNQAVSAYNEAVGQFPTRLLTRLFGLRPAGRL